MHLNDDPLNLYDILELTPDATPQEIRSAYLRLKSAYGKDNIAHYSVFSREETESMLQNVENAYLVLSNPEKRRSYDEAQGFRPSSQPPVHTQSSNPDADFFSLSGSPQGPQSGALSSAHLAGLTATPISTATAASAVTSAAAMISSHHPLQPSLETMMNDIDLIIKNEQFWTGASLRRIREARRISLEDLSDYTRISRTYLHALEEENYNRLPAVVYVRGFLQQISRRLKLPADLVTRTYLDRMRDSAPEKR
jgi:curved DNA-binding protein CbpA